jgi:hypothetical protein
MDKPGFGCEWETMVIVEHRNSEMYVQNTWMLGSLIQKAV